MSSALGSVRLQTQGGKIASNRCVPRESLGSHQGGFGRIECLQYRLSHRARISDLTSPVGDGVVEGDGVGADKGVVVAIWS
ncbi:hypothetical protein [Leptolyngbya sp. 7M]|uniref:hypothetical protein n=1 Tax=Leptolyngbya sp. 7M TaxID=2812896 RepID=UPI001CECE792|nr:hypothetical protein [Leptolyngbya sp. 7M]